MKEYVENGRLRIIAKPNAKKTEVLGYDENRKAVRIAIAAVPDKDKANKELLKFLSKKLGKVSIIKGARTKEKTVLVHNI